MSGQITGQPASGAPLATLAAEPQGSNAGASAPAGGAPSAIPAAVTDATAGASEATGGGAPSATPAAAAAMRKYKADGREWEVPETEVDRLLSMGHNYSFRSGKVSEERKALEAERAAFKAEREAFERERGGRDRGARAPETPERREGDPFGGLEPEIAAAVRAQLEGFNSKLQSVESTVSGMTARQQATHTKNVIVSAMREVETAYPDADPEVVMHMFANVVRDGDDDETLKNLIIDAARLDAARIAKARTGAVDGAIGAKATAAPAAAGRPAGKPVYVPDVSSLSSTIREARKVLGA